MRRSRGEDCSTLTRMGRSWPFAVILSFAGLAGPDASLAATWTCDIGKTLFISAGNREARLSLASPIIFDSGLEAPEVTLHCVGEGEIDQAKLKCNRGEKDVRVIWSGAANGRVEAQCVPNSFVPEEPRVLPEANDGPEEEPPAEN